MNSTLKALYDGEIFPAEQYLPKTKEYLTMRQEHYRHYQDFIRKLDSPLDKEFKDIIDEQLDEFPLEFHQVFIDGFRLGAKMMIEVYQDESHDDTV